MNNTDLLTVKKYLIKFFLLLKRYYNFSFFFFLNVGSFGGIRLYLQELITITQKALQSQSWKMKAQGAIAMASIAKQTSSLVPPYLGMVLSALVQGLAGRTWAGKVKEFMVKNWDCIFL